ncbi:MAG: hypothetical protein KAW94_03995 [Candidatus Thorarchaeota archaeon]|nr:hypothetical protein [Candidatus Thorarchaeota archaeon]
MAANTLSEVANLLEDALSIHQSVRQVVLSTQEGVVVASVSKAEDTDPRLLATVSAALQWAGTTTLSHIDKGKPIVMLQSTKIEQVLTVLQPQYQLTVVLSRGADADLDVGGIIPAFQSIATRIQLLMGASFDYGGESILGKVVKTVPEVTQAILLTMDGLPLGAVGFENHVEVAALASSMFANGLTFSDHTDAIIVSSETTDLLMAKVDDKRLLLVACHGSDSGELCQRVRDVLESYP